MTDIGWDLGSEGVREVVICRDAYTLEKYKKGMDSSNYFGLQKSYSHSFWGFLTFLTESI